MRFDDETTSAYRGHGFIREEGPIKSVNPDQYTYALEQSGDGYNVVRYKDDNSYKSILFKANTEQSAKEYLQALQFIIS